MTSTTTRTASAGGRAVVTAGRPLAVSGRGGIRRRRGGQSLSLMYSPLWYWSSCHRSASMS